MMLDVRDLVSQFPGAAGPVVAVDGATLHVDAGETLCLVGESGSGKTALLRSVIGLMPGGRAAHPRGTISFRGAELLAQDEAQWRAVRGRDIGMIFQEPMTSLNPVMRVGDQVGETLRAHGLADRRAATERAVAALRAVGIPDAARAARRYPHELSGGMRQRAMIAAATIAEPALLLADEPTTALDVTIEAQILELLAQLRRERDMALLFVTHDLGVVAEIGDRVAVMYAGQIVETAPVAALFAAPRHPYSEGLLLSMPRRGVRRHRLAQIPGVVPPPRARPSACLFADRCPYVESACRAASPPLVDLGGGHSSRCLKPQAIGGGYREASA